jgi:AraC-like DNA-binding protein
VGEKDKIQGLEIGADDYLIKPFNFHELNVRVRNLIKIRKTLRNKFSKTSIIKSEEVSAVSLDQQFLNLVIKIINENLSDISFSVEKLADLVAISPSQLNRKLNGLIGQPAGQFIRLTRLEKATLLIKRGDMPLKEIACEVGFSEQSGFAKSFKKHFGVPPAQYLSN